MSVVVEVVVIAGLVPCLTVINLVVVLDVVRIDVRVVVLDAVRGCVVNLAIHQRFFCSIEVVVVVVVVVEVVDVVVIKLVVVGSDVVVVFFVDTVLPLGLNTVNL